MRPLALLLTFAVGAWACSEPINRDAVRAHKRMLAKRDPQTAPAPVAAAASSSSTTAASSSSAVVVAASSSAPVIAASSSAVVAASNSASSASSSVSQVPLPTDPFATVPLAQITSGMPTQAIPTLSTTPAAGATPAISGAPLLPSLTIAASAYPPENTVPPVDSDQVKIWMQEISGIDPAILAITPTTDGTCAGSPEAAADASRCWWTCGGCTNNTEPYQDITVCPDKNTWGLSFDDGPSPYTPKVLDFLSEKDISGTFFIVGSRVLERPAILQATYMDAHHIAAHTWSHSVPLTALSNAQVVAELGWSRQIIHDTIGVSPVFMRPPWGDIDNRVRAISLAMGMRPIIWTRNPTTKEQFDTNDWRVPGGTVTGTDSLASFQAILSNASILDTGFIVLQHDLFQQEVDLSTGYSIPAAIQAGFKLEDINTCIHQAPGEAYLETIADKKDVPTYPGAGSVDVKGDGKGIEGTGNGTTVNGVASEGGAVHLVFSLQTLMLVLGSVFLL